MMMRPAKVEGPRPTLSFHRLIKPADKTKLILYMMKNLGYSETKATRLAGL